MGGVASRRREGPARREGVAEDTPLQPKAPKQPPPADGVQAWRVCAAVAAVEVPALERHRHQLLLACLAMALAGVALSTAGLCGGYSRSQAVVTRLPWIVGQQAESGRQFYGGVMYVCAGRGAREAVCKSWSRDPVCQAQGASTEPCEACREASIEIGVAAGVAFATYASFAIKTYQRLKGEDSNLTKFIASVLTTIGALNFLFALWRFDTTCIKVAERFESVDMRAGLGYTCLVVATLLKVPMGALHLALPVRPRGLPRPAPEDDGRAC